MNTNLKVINSREFRKLVDDYSIHQSLAYNYCLGLLSKKDASAVILKKAWEITRTSEGKKIFKEVLKAEWDYYKEKIKNIEKVLDFSIENCDS